MKSKNLTKLLMPLIVLSLVVVMVIGAASAEIGGSIDGTVPQDPMISEPTDTTEIGGNADGTLPIATKTIRKTTIAKETNSKLTKIIENKKIKTPKIKQIIYCKYFFIIDPRMLALVK